MTGAWIPRPPRRGEKARAGAAAIVVGVAAGLAALYLARLVLFRDELSLTPTEAPGAGEGP